MAIIRRKNKKKSPLQFEMAEDVLNFARQNNIKAVPLDIGALMELMGIKIICSNTLPDNTSGILKETELGWVCEVNAKHHITRQRFTLAHQLAHYILHRDDETKEFIDYAYLGKSINNNRIELEANEFAINLLMPKADFKYYIQNVSKDSDDVAKYFKVSPLAVRLKVNQLNYKII
jgi:Zn-dependent peptidase ImmA (M78 family)